MKHSCRFDFLQDISKNSSLKTEKEQLEKDEAEWKQKDEEIKKQERIRPLDVDDLTHEGKSKTSINKKVTEERPKNMTEDEQAEYYVSCSSFINLPLFH